MGDSKINESSFISISLMVTILGGASFVSYVAFESKSNAKAIEVIQKKQETLEVIATDIAVIKEKVGTIEKSLERTK